VYRSDQLIGADVVNAQGDDLGDVYDVVMSPQTGKISYLVVGRGGVFGIGENHIPVPWGAFKVAAGSNLMVLDTTKSNLDAAPRVAESHFSPRGDVGEQGQGVDAFWKTRLLK
jgi:sporulation protein YlmC with PRC-barrel domain